jgi:exodeoxyribonuclease-3
MVRIVSWNVNGVRATHERGDLDWLWNGDADIVCLQETKATLEQVEKVDPKLAAPDGWRAFWCWGERKGYSGTATFVREGLAGELIGTGFGIERFDNEGRVVVTDHGAFVLLNIYFPNGGTGEKRLNYKMDFYAAFREYVEKLVDEGRDVVVGGDVNTALLDIDVADPERWADISGFLPMEREWLADFADSGWIDTFRAEHGDRPHEYTFWETRTDARRDNYGWRIDYFFVNERLEDFLVDAWTSPHIMGSDHCPIGVELELDLFEE